MSLDIYLDLMSPPCRAVVFMAQKNNIPYTEKTLDLFKGDQLKDEFFQVNPLQKVPVICHDGFKLTESVAILKYLAAMYPVADHWYPKEPQARALVDEYFAWQHCSLWMNIVPYFLSHTLIPKISGKPVAEKKVQEMKENLELTVGVLQSKFLQEKSFLCGSQISIADLLAYCYLQQPKAVGYDTLAGKPQLEAWLCRVEEVLGDELLQDVNARLQNVEQIVNSSDLSSDMIEIVKKRLRMLFD
uniref:glutathione S-transferase theta-1-like n=1 Tax=Myxine glutinosa TaxID=7769 RepID=UPI00358E32CE